MFELNALKSKKLQNIQEIAKSIGLKNISNQKKQELIYQIIDHISANPNSIPKREGTQKENEVDGSLKNKSIKDINQDVKIKNSSTSKQIRKDNIPKNIGNKDNTRPKHFQNKNNNQRKDSNHNRDNRNRYREPDFEFEGIIKTEGVLEKMQEGYGFLRSSNSKSGSLYRFLLSLL